jgi:hypothetical protein
MVIHLVLYRPKPDLQAVDREAFQRALDAAVTAIPSIVRCRVGRRLRLGTTYDALMAEDYEFVGLFEFADVAGLRAYLEHPAHARLGELFYSCNAAALAYDYALVEGDTVGPAPRGPS